MIYITGMHIIKTYRVKNRLSPQLFEERFVAPAFNAFIDILKITNQNNMEQGGSL